MITRALKDSIFFNTYLKNNELCFVWQCGFFSNHVYSIIRFCFSVSENFRKAEVRVISGLKTLKFNIQNNIKLEKEVFMKKSPEIHLHLF